ncbi:MAG: hypothetical protein E3J96_05900 [Sulfurovum sp.]|nr:MAG: hypothetical protein E3J96_05900 [Sulfurovum sp.]
MTSDNIEKMIKLSLGGYKNKEIATLLNISADTISYNLLRNNIRQHRKRGSIKNKKLYDVWREMKQRCFNKNHKSYKYYGAKNIKVCDEWINDYTSFENWALQNGYKNTLTIDRIANDGDYELSNCQWITQREQILKQDRFSYRLKDNK